MFAYLVIIEAQHDFNAVVARHVILGDTDYMTRATAERWAGRRVESELQTAAADDPDNADIHGFHAVVCSVTWSKE